MSSPHIERLPENITVISQPDQFEDYQEKDKSPLSQPITFVYGGTSAAVVERYIDWRNMNRPSITDVAVLPFCMIIRIQKVTSRRYSHLQAYKWVGSPIYKGVGQCQQGHTFLFAFAADISEKDTVINKFFGITFSTSQANQAIQAWIEANRPNDYVFIIEHDTEVFPTPGPVIEK